MNLQRVFQLFPNQTNYDAVAEQLILLEGARNDVSRTPEERLAAAHMTQRLNDWLRHARASPCLRTLTMRTAVPVDMQDRNALYAFWKQEVVIETGNKRRKCLRLGGTTDILVKVRTIRDGLVLGSIDQYVAGHLEEDDGYHFFVPSPRPLQFAVKNFMKEKLGQTQENYERELAVQYRLTELDSEYILPVYHYLETPDRFMAVLPLVEGGDLFDFLSHTDLTLDTARPLMASMIKGVMTLHSIGFAHRDISPENFLMASNDRTLLMDFGLAAEMSEDWQVDHTGHVGKQAYVAPELQTMTATYDGRKIDIWSLGMTFYVLLTREFLWRSIPNPRSTNFREAWSQIPNRLARHVPPPGLNVFIDLVMSMLRLDPQERPTADELLEHPFFGM